MKLPNLSDVQAELSCEIRSHTETMMLLKRSPGDEKLLEKIEKHRKKIMLLSQKQKEVLGGRGQQSQAATLTHSSFSQASSAAAAAAPVSQSTSTCDQSNKDECVAKPPPPPSEEELPPSPERSFFAAVGLISVAESRHMESTEESEKKAVIDRKRRITANPQFSHSPEKRKGTVGSAECRKARERLKDEEQDMDDDEDEEEEDEVALQSLLEVTSAAAAASHDLNSDARSTSASNSPTPPANTEECSRPERKDVCRVCLQSGDVLMCDNCYKLHHLHCLNPPLLAVPGGDWFCPTCAEPPSQNETRVDSTTAALANYLQHRTNMEEKKRQLIQQESLLREKVKLLEDELHAELSHQDPGKQDSLQKKLDNIKTFREQLKS